MTTDIALIKLIVNGADREVAVEPRRTLADVLRHDLRLTGTHVGCEQGVCGACTVLLDGRAVRSCLIFGVQANGSAVTTVEGLEVDGQIGDLQDAFSRCHALQCGFCTPGLLMLATAFLAETPCPTKTEIREALSSNICRCTGYQGIVDAVAEVAERRAVHES